MLSGYEMGSSELHPLLSPAGPCKHMDTPVSTHVGFTLALRGAPHSVPQASLLRHVGAILIHLGAGPLA